MEKNISGFKIIYLKFIYLIIINIIKFYIKISFYIYFYNNDSFEVIFI